MFRRRVLYTFVVAALVITLASCNFFDQKGTLTSISVTPVFPVVATGATQQFTATGVNDDGSTSTLSGVAWSASTPTGGCISSGCTATVTIDTTGVATASGSEGTGTGPILGLSTITATSGSLTGSTTMSVATVALTSITLTPSNPSVSMTGTKTVQIDALFNGTSGQTMNSSVQWTSSDKTVATVSSSGLVTGIKSSTTPVTITATAGSITASTTVTVNP